MAIPASILLPILVAGLFVTYKIIEYIVAARSFRQFEKANGCMNPACYPHKYPLGIDFVLRIQKDSKNGELLKSGVSRFEKMGHTFMNRFLTSRDIITRDPENIKAVLAKQFHEFDLGPNRHNAFEPFMGDGIFTVMGQAWEHSRALLRPQFNRMQITTDLTSQDFHVDRLMNRFMERSVGDGAKMFDAQPWFFRLTLDTATEFLFGESVESLMDPEETSEGFSGDDAVGFSQAFNVGLQWLARKMRMGNFYAYVGGKEFDRACLYARSYVGRFVDRAIALREQNRSIEKKAQGKYVFLEALAEETQDRKMLTDQILNILLAGRDTTAGLLSIMVWLLARNADVYQRLRQEVNEKVGPTEAPTWEIIKDMKYLKNVLNEGLRLFPIVPFNSRQATVRTTIPRGGGPNGDRPIAIEKNQKVVYSVYAMQRREDIYGADANEFNPDRWENLRVGWEYLPFNGGPRICLGQQFALMEASFVLIRLCQNFEDIIGFDRITPQDAKDEHGNLIPTEWRKAPNVNNRDARQMKEFVSLTMSILDGAMVKMIPAATRPQRNY